MKEKDLNDANDLKARSSWAMSLWSLSSLASFWGASHA